MHSNFSFHELWDTCNVPSFIRLNSLLFSGFSSSSSYKLVLSKILHVLVRLACACDKNKGKRGKLNAHLSIIEGKKEILLSALVTTDSSLRVYR